LNALARVEAERACVTQLTSRQSNAV